MPTVVHLTAGPPPGNATHTYTNPGPRTQQVVFAHASARLFSLALSPPVLQVLHTPNGGVEVEVDMVTLWGPHSWWGLTGQPLCPDLKPGDTLKLFLFSAAAAVDIRYDLKDVT